MQTIIGIQDLKKQFNDPSGKNLLALDHINLEIFEGEFFTILGPSGSGKSTLLRIMSGLEKDYEGTVTLNKNIGAHNMGFIFQQFALLPWLTVAKNIELGLIAKKIPPIERKKIVAQEMQQFHLENFSEAYPRELSGGMLQRVGLARALAINAKIIFMDEPFSELDSFTANELREELLAIWQKRRPTIIMVTHLIDEALELSDRIAVLTSRPGKIEKIIKNILPRPRNKRSEDFYHLTDLLYKIIKP